MLPRIHTHFLQRIIDHVRMREVVIGKEIKLVQKVANVDAAEWIHLGKRQNTWESKLESQHRQNIIVLSRQKLTLDLPLDYQGCTN